MTVTITTVVLGISFLIMNVRCYYQTPYPMIFDDFYNRKPTTPSNDHTETTTPKICGLCRPVHPQQEFCDSSAVIKARVIKKGDNGTYIIRVFRVFKGPQALRSLKEMDNFYFCPVNLLVRKTYILTGETDSAGTFFRTTICHWAQLFNTLSSRQKTGLRIGYKMGCKNCKIEACYGNDCKGDKSNHCEMNEEWSGSALHCFIEHAYCAKKQGRCQWVSNKITFVNRRRKITPVDCTKE